tara:strand:+ start:1634 stop:2491 length:858 start_codon:yes stop_codon:yes gene_type:complete
MKINLVFISTIFIFFFSCDSSNELVSQDLNGKKSLVTKTIYIDQIIQGTKTERPVIIQTSANINSDVDYPIVFALHGKGGKNTSWVNQLKSFTDSGEFVGIYPQGHLDSWNLGTEPSKADDVAFINSIIKELENYNNLNMNKIYAIGTSNGSGMVNKLGIHTSHFKAIAPVVSQLMESMPIQDNTKPLSIFQINGAKDSTIPIDGGIAFGHNFLDALKSAELWAINFECALPPQKKIMNDKTIYTFIGCNDNKEIKYIRVENGGHNLRPTYPNMFSDIWNFFKRF